MSASEVIKARIREAGGEVEVQLLNGDTAVVKNDYGNCFVSNKLPSQEVNYSIFDIVVDFLKTQPQAKAPKGGCRNSKIGANQCGRGTVMYAIATQYYGKAEGESCYDPLFVIAAILDWANIATNGRGFLKLINPSIW